jgi:hypothetical protein
MIKWINKLVGKKIVSQPKTDERKMTPEERYIMSRNPQSILDVETFSREFERLSWNDRKPFINGY